MNWIRLEHNLDENLYTQKISLKDEMPRLTAQANLFKHLLEPFLKTVGYPNWSGVGLDAGAGPGVLTGMLMKLNPNMKWHACDISDEMVQYGKLSYSKAQWKKSDIRKLEYSDNEFDMVFNSMVLIHLANPKEALVEFQRVLKPQGRLLITCPNDSTFEGPEVLLKMVKKHAEIHPADRYVMNKLPDMMKEFNFELESREDFIATNDGSDDKINLDYPTIHLGLMTGWSMLSFMGHPNGMQELYEACQEDYMNNLVKFKTKIEVHIYKKLGDIV
jgi:SAM-dependent methyltransferase